MEDVFVGSVLFIAVSGLSILEPGKVFMCNVSEAVASIFSLCECEGGSSLKLNMLPEDGNSSFRNVVHECYTWFKNR